jgi:hypothetical protein
VVLTSKPKNTPYPPISSEMKIISQTLQEGLRFSV